MPRIIRMYILQSLIGVGIATVFVAALLALNVADLWYLVTHTGIGPFAALLLWTHCAAVFAGVQFAISVMRLGEADGDSEGPRGGHRQRRPVPVEVESEVESPMPRIGRKRASGRPD